MKYPNIQSAVFLRRPNRFVAVVSYQGKEEVVHVKNTGRCKELLIPGQLVFLTEPKGNARKTRFDLVAVEKKREGRESLLINMDSQLPNSAVAEWLFSSGLFSPNAVIKREVFFHKSRFDFYVEDGNRKAYLEVKGVTLEENSKAYFPDAPTLRGIKHLEELCLALKEGYEAYVLFVIQMKGVSSFSPNDKTHPQFGAALRKAHKEGVRILALDCLVTADSMVIDQNVPIKL